MKNGTLFFLASLVVFYQSFVNAQSDFIEPIARTSFFSESTLENLYYNQASDTRYLEVTPIRMNNLWDFNSMGELTFNLPGVEKPIHAVVSTPKRFSETEYSWVGNILDETKQIIGHVNFIQKGDKKFGSISIENRRFIIRDLNTVFDDDQLLVEIDKESIVTACGVGNEHDSVIVNDPVFFGPTGGGDDCEAVITVLILYTQEVMMDENIMEEQLADLGILDLNTALTESSIPNTQVAVEVAAYELLEGYIEQSDADDALEDLSQNENIPALRDEHNADLVVLFQRTDLFRTTTSDGVLVIEDIAGYANINGVDNTDDVPDINRVFSIIEADASSEIFAHEVGHLLGCRHIKENDPHEYANAYDEVCTQPIVVGGQMECNQYKSTIMDGLGDADRVLRFSNPDGDYMGYAIGDTDHNNAQMIALTACPISLFGGMVEGEFEDPPFNMYATGPLEVSHDEYTYYEYSTYYHGCLDGFVDYFWDISWDYQNTFQPLSTDENAIIEGTDIPLDMPIGYLRVKAHCSEEPDTVVKILELRNWSALNLEAKPNGETIVESNDSNFKVLDEEEITVGSGEEDVFRAYPNPVKDILVIEYGALSGTTLDITLTSAHGIKHKLYDGTLHAAKMNESFDISELLPGFYYLEINTNAKYFCKPLIIVQ